MAASIKHPNETTANRLREKLGGVEPRALRTYTPTQIVIAKSAGVFHWTTDGRRLYDFSSGVLVSNLGHNPASWFRRLTEYMDWPTGNTTANAQAFIPTVPLTTYNAITPIEVEACSRLLGTLRKSPGGSRMEQVLWAASGSEAIQKAIWSSLASDRARPIILATRNGFHGKKGLANAVTGSEADA
ncbi:MAG TPA: aminotransferase class III-fold pyridoxal phosphate-dependent enzyme, partial [Gemmata sp.]|nr:aminotransferase class III-fold pyridoxal phosphate-dependent enzyme [Gemmata sp.]